MTDPAAHDPGAAVSAVDLVSVIIPTRDRPDFLPRAIQSVLDQTHKALEIIVVDDGSTIPVLSPGDPRIRIIRLENSVGNAAARNRGLRESTGRYIAFLDDDDYYFPTKIALQLDYLRTHPDVDLVFSRLLNTLPDGRQYSEPRQVAAGRITPRDQFLYFMKPNAVLFKRELTERISFDERLTRYCDIQYFGAASLVANIHHLPVDVAVWNLGTHARVGSRSVWRSYPNWKLLCEIFGDTIDNDPLLRRRYYLKLAKLAVRHLRLDVSLCALWKAFRRREPA